MNKLWYIPIVGYEVTKRNKLLIHTITWINFKCIMLKEARFKRLQNCDSIYNYILEKAGVWGWRIDDWFPESGERVNHKGPGKNWEGEILEFGSGYMTVGIFHYSWKCAQSMNFTVGKWCLSFLKKDKINLLTFKNLVLRIWNSS